MYDDLGSLKRFLKLKADEGLCVSVSSLGGLTLYTQPVSVECIKWHWTTQDCFHRWSLSMSVQTGSCCFSVPTQMKQQEEVEKRAEVAMEMSDLVVYCQPRSKEKDRFGNHTLYNLYTTWHDGRSVPTWVVQFFLVLVILSFKIGTFLVEP